VWTNLIDEVTGKTLSLAPGESGEVKKIDSNDPYLTVAPKRSKKEPAVTEVNAESKEAE
jgi:hypothetical protein